ncbi:histidine phosphatase family protein [Bacillus sp. es.036]|uniref:histidine phosphatase family protein n=1 Tax=Bacillus sp. es.036 TaxID=1761764 RepID=UPI000BFA318F|nr:histidine phosphatase family protein [Bacillus sp. es.036]PFG14915.1 2,3-bisphosphoglycerate-dependent phosphoglycerate mutase [Bacillus sp. es.036]
MKQTEIYLVRHAHSTYSPDEYGRGLSSNGHHHQKLLTHQMAENHVDVILSSPYKRAIQTVEGIALQHNKDIQLIEAFKERTLAGKSVENFQEAIETVWLNESYAHPGGESNEKARNRGIDALKDVLKTYEGKSIVIGTHGNMLALIMSHFDQKYDVTFWRNLDMPDVYCLTFEEETLMNVERIWERAN